MLNVKVLLLNQNYEPLTVVSAKKAIVLFYLEKAEIIEKRDWLVRSQHLAFPLPSIIRLLRYIYIPHKHVELSRRNILKRDNFRCQYCLTTKGPFTVDHVVPRTLGGADTWENLVCACVSCNNKKGNRTPERANMKLLKKPRRPSHIFFIQNFMGIGEECWKPYIFMN
ncbi:HNH endonuclease [candidate division KSB1 bacterium]|nr:HNH endonuclease [candidate division KSB1 bacterium]